MYNVDARGLSCPEPIILLKKALKDNDQVLLTVDNKTSVETCTRFSESKGYSVTVKTSGSVHELTVVKK